MSAGHRHALPPLRLSFSKAFCNNYNMLPRLKAFAFASSLLMLAIILQNDSQACTLRFPGPWFWSIQRTALSSDEIFVGRVIAAKELAEQNCQNISRATKCYEYDFEVLRWLKGESKKKDYSLRTGSDTPPRRHSEVTYTSDCRLTVTFDLGKTYLVMPKAFHARAYMEVTGPDDPWVHFIEKALKRGSKIPDIIYVLSSVDIEGFVEEAQWQQSHNDDERAIKLYRDAIHGCQLQKAGNRGECKSTLIERAIAEVAVIQKKHRPRLTKLETKARAHYKNGHFKQAYKEINEVRKFLDDPALLEFQDEVFRAWTGGRKKNDAAPAPSLAVTTRALIDKLKVGDPISIEFLIKNEGPDDFKYRDRSYDRSGRMQEYSLTAFAPNGIQVEDPRGNSVRFSGGLAQEKILGAGQSFRKTIVLNEWAHITKPGKYKVTGRYQPFWPQRADVESPSIVIEVQARSQAEMTAYIKQLIAELEQAKTMQDRDRIAEKMAYTGRAEIIQPLIDSMYRFEHNYWPSTALSVYLKNSQPAVSKAILKTAKKRGLADGMLVIIKETATAKEMYPLIEISLAQNNRSRWQAGAIAAKHFPDDRHNARLIAIAKQILDECSQQTSTKCHMMSKPSLVFVLGALANNRTESGVKLLQELLKHQDEYVRKTTELAVRGAYHSASGKQLTKDDFDSSLQKGYIGARVVKRHSPIKRKPDTKTKAMRVLAHKVCQGETSALEELKRIAEYITKKPDSKSSATNKKYTYRHLEAAFEVFGAEAAKGNPKAIDVLRLSLRTRALQRFAPAALGQAATAGQPEALQILTHPLYWRISLPEAAYALMGAAEKNNTKAVDFIVEAVANPQMNSFKPVLLKALTAAAKLGNERARKAIAQHQ